MARREQKKRVTKAKVAKRVRAIPKDFHTVMFWGDRYGRVVDPFGHEWGLATHKEDLTPKEVGKRAQAFFAQMAKPNP